MSDPIADIEVKATEDIEKYFDRINDKLFTVNTTFIAIYLAAATLSYIDIFLIGLPIANFIFLIFSDFWMMEFNRIQSRVISNPPTENKKGEVYNSRATLLSLASIICTLVVVMTAVFFAYKNIKD